jgi:NADP-dependent 3-hydroxy acid dehydrogenase YdfG
MGEPKGEAMSKRLDGKVALVTGASSGIGRGIALELAKAGATVAVAARREDRLAELVSEIEAVGSKALALTGDMAVESEAKKAVEQTVEQLGRIDILINSAGIMRMGGIEGASLAEFRQVFEINVFGTLYACAAAVPHMLAQGGGDIVNVTSLAARKGGAGTNAYSSSKHAAHAMSDGMRQELGNRNIRVMEYLPGATTSEVGDSIPDPRSRKFIQSHVAKDGAIKPSEVGEVVVFMLAMPRHVNISEISVRPTTDTTP